MLHLHSSPAFPEAFSGGRRRAFLHRAERGLTVVEMLVAVALLGFILLAIAPLFIGSVKANYSGSQYTSVNMLARDRLEQLMNRSFLDPQLAPGNHSVNDQPAYLANPLNPTLLSTVPNPFKVTYQVTQWTIPVATCPPPYTGCTVAPNASFTPTLAATGQPYQYKRIDVTVDSSASAGVAAPFLGIGARLVRVAGTLANPAPELNVAVAPCSPCP